MTDLYEKYIKRVEAINSAKTQHEHDYLSARLGGWLDGVDDAGSHVRTGSLCMAADNFYMDQGIDRPMCGGIFLDWKPEEQS